MTDGILAGLIAAVDTAIRALLRAMRSLGGTFSAKPPAKRPRAQFGEHERFEESKYYLPAPAPALKLEEGDLPDSYGETRVVLLVVDPNLVHAYWEISPGRLLEAKSRAGEVAQAVLRFHEASGSFDVDVDLGARNWYVPLWSAGKTYYVDLGFRSADGSFAELASSNVVLTPRVVPAREIKERFMRVSETEKHPESVPPPPYRKPRLPQMRLQQVSPNAGMAGEPAAVTPPALRSLPMGIRRPAGAVEVLRRRLLGFYALRERHPEPARPEESRVRGRAESSPVEPASDLTELAEQRQILGLSSGLLQGGRPKE